MLPGNLLSFGKSAYNATGVIPSEFSMTGLSGSVPTPEILLIGAGAVMVVTLWFSSKARSVVDTGINLSRQGDAVERFDPNWLSRGNCKVFCTIW